MMTSSQMPLTAGTPEHRWWILAVLATAQLMVALDATVVSIALPHAQATLHFSSADRQWIVTAYALAFGSLLLPGGRLADIYGRKRLFLAGAAGFAAASAAGGASQSFAMLVTARAAQGAFAAVLAPAALSLLTTTFSHPHERGKAFGIYGGIATAGASAGLLAGGALTQYLTWRWTMFINVPIAGIVITSGVIFLSSRRAEARQRVDWAGAVLGGLGLFAVVYGFAHAATKPGSAGWADPRTTGSIAAGIVLLAAFVIAERRAAHPLLPLRVVLDRNRGGSCSALLLAPIGLFSVFLFLTYYLETIQGYSPVRTGLAFLPLTVTVLFSAGVSNTILLPRVSPRLLVPAGLLLAAAGMALSWARCRALISVPAVPRRTDTPNPFDPLCRARPQDLSDTMPATRIVRRPIRSRNRGRRRTSLRRVERNIMKAAQFSQFGGPEVLEIVDLPDPHPGPGQVRIVVHAAGISATDPKLRAGTLSFGAQLPQTTGRDVAGVVDETGEGVTDVAAGDRVFGVSDDGAGAAELALLTFRAIIPPSLGFIDAAALPVALETATRAIDQLGVTSGSTLFINGASGGIGSTAVQLAAARGARVIGAASTANQDYLALLGAEPVTYGEGMTGRVRALAPGGVDVALDVAGNGILPQLIDLAGGSQNVVTLADFDGPKEHGVRFSNGFADGHAFYCLAEIGELIQAGRFWLPVDRTFPLTQIAQAHRTSEHGHVRGRLVLAIG